MYECQRGKFVCGFWGLKGLIHHHRVGLERLTAEMEVVGFYSWGWTCTQGLKITEK